MEILPTLSNFFQTPSITNNVKVNCAPHAGSNSLVFGNSEPWIKSTCTVLDKKAYTRIVNYHTMYKLLVTIAAYIAWGSREMNNLRVSKNAIELSIPPG